MILYSSKKGDGFVFKLQPDEFALLARPASMHGMLKKAETRTRDLGAPMRVLYSFEEDFYFLYIPEAAATALKEAGPGAQIDVDILLAVI